MSTTHETPPSDASHSSPDGREQVDIGALFGAHAAVVSRVVCRLTGPGSHVDDVVQEVFLTAHRRREDLDPSTNLKSWLCRVAVNLVRHHRRTFARRRAFEERLRSSNQATASESVGPEAHLARSEAQRMVQRVVDKLPIKQREVFVLFELEEMEGKEIAEMLGVPENTVWTRLHHARARFRKLWTQLQKREDHAAMA